MFGVLNGKDEECLIIVGWNKAMKIVLVMFCVMFSSVLYAAEIDDIGEGGLHTQDWFSVSFKDIAEDINDAKADGKRLALVFEQTGCVYCRKMHEVILSDPTIKEYLQANFNILQMNLFGSEEVTDLDGEVLSEKAAAVKWGVMFTPTILFMPEDVPSEPSSALQAAVAALPGGFGKLTFLHTFQWVEEKGYEGDEHFQKYHARKLQQTQ